VTANAAARGKVLAESNKYLPPRREHLGRLDAWGLDVFEGSPQAWKDALLAESEGR
jgi:tRNA U34 5-methylaminomethyl-2-thiouridine-forming methyltransferase MnmC